MIKSESFRSEGSWKSQETGSAFTRQSYGTIVKDEREEARRQRNITRLLRQESNTFQNQYYCSTLVVYFNVLTGDMSRGIFLPTLWLYVHSLGGSKSFLGMIVSSYSMGRIIAAPAFGYLSEIVGHQQTMIFCNVVILGGTLVYALAKSLPVLLLANFIIGIGAGSTGVTRSFIAATTPTTHRTESIAYLTALQYAGFTVTPIIGSALSAIFASPALLLLNKFSAPAYFLALMSMISSSLLLVFFRDLLGDSYSSRCENPNETSGLEVPYEYSPIEDENTQEDQELEGAADDDLLLNEREGSGDIEKEESLNDNYAVIEQWRTLILLFGMLLNFITKGTIGVFETLMIIITIKYFHWDEVKTGFIISIFGAIGVIILLNFSLLLKYFKDYQLVPLGMVFMVVSCLLLNNNYFLFSFSYNDSLLVVSLICMLSIGYPIAHTTLIALFSRLLLLQEKQGKSLGLFSSVGSLARIVFPIVSGVVMDYHHHFNIIFLILSVILFFSLIVYLKLESLISKLLF